MSGVDNPAAKTGSFKLGEPTVHRVGFPAIANDRPYAEGARRDRSEM
jgi:hypothetical protein